MTSHFKFALGEEMLLEFQIFILQLKLCRNIAMSLAMSDMLTCVVEEMLFKSFNSKTGVDVYLFYYVGMDLLPGVI